MLQIMGNRPGTGLCGQLAQGAALRSSQQFLGTRRTLVGLRRPTYLRPAGPVMALLGGHEAMSRRVARELQELRPGPPPQAPNMWAAAASALSNVQERIAEFERGAQQLVEAHDKAVEALHVAAGGSGKKRVHDLISVFERGMQQAATSASKNLRSAAAPQPHKMSEESTARLAALNAEMAALRSALKEASLVSGQELAQPTVAAAVVEEPAVHAPAVEEATAEPQPVAQPSREGGRRGGKGYVFGVFAAAAGALSNAFQTKSAKAVPQSAEWQATQSLFSFTGKQAQQEEEAEVVVALESSATPATELVDVEVVCPEELEQGQEPLVVRAHTLDNPALFGSGLLPLELAAEEAMPNMLPVAAMLWGSSLPGATQKAEATEGEQLELKLAPRTPTGVTTRPMASWPVSKAMASLGFVMTFYSIARYRVQARGSNLLPLAHSALPRLAAGSSDAAAVGGASAASGQHLAALSRIEERLAGIGQRLASIEQRVAAMKRE